MPQSKTVNLASRIASGESRAIARGITVVENRLPGADHLLSVLKPQVAKCVGITGPPGAGKSTLVAALLRHWTNDGKRIAVLAVDPSSPFNFGALLGDRIRMSRFYNHPDVFIRSLASRGALGGLHPRIIEIIELLKAAPFDYILIETVGVGQSEVDIAGLADCTVVTLVPEGGDVVQTLKAGLMEVADIFVINKADREGADALYSSLRTMVHERAGNEPETPVLKTIAAEEKGIGELVATIENLLGSNMAFSERKLHLLAQKCWAIIAEERMQDITATALEAALKAAMTDKEFSIYAFAKKMAR